TDRGSRASAIPRTCSIIGVPATRWSTLGRADFMRVPFPAARIATWMSILGRCQTLRSGHLSIIAPIEAESAVVWGRADARVPVALRALLETRRHHGAVRDQDRCGRARGFRD